MSRTPFRCSIIIGLVAALNGCGGTDPSPPPPPPLTIARVVIEPASAIGKVGELKGFGAYAEAANGTRIPGSATFASSDATIASIVPPSAFTGQRVGLVTITATIQGVQGTASLRVAPAINLGPVLPSLHEGDTLRLSAQTITSVQGATGPPPTFASRSPATAIVSPDGVVSGLVPGLAWIVATAETTAESVFVAVVKRITGPNREVVAACSQPVRLCRYGTTTDTVSPAGKAVLSFNWARSGEYLALLLEGLPGVFELWRTSGTGTAALQVATPVAGNGLPAISPDGNHLVFEDQNNQLSIRAQLLGTTLPLSAGATGQQSDPEFSPDGRQVAYRHNGIVRIMSVNRLVPERTVSVPGTASSFRWSPDGKFLAVGSIGFDGNQQPMWHGVWLIRPDGTGLRPISPNCGPGPTCVAGNYQEPRWSPEGQRLGLWFFSVVQGENTPGFEVRDVLTGALVSAFQAPGLSVPDWSPDGMRIAWTGYEDGTQNTAVFTSRADGSDRQQLSVAGIYGRVLFRP